MEEEEESHLLKKIKRTSLRSKAFAPQMIRLRNCKDKPQIGRKDWQCIQPSTGSYPDFIKPSQDSKTKRNKYEEKTGGIAL